MVMQMEVKDPAQQPMVLETVCVQSMRSSGNGVAVGDNVSMRNCDVIQMLV